MTSRRKVSRTLVTLGCIVLLVAAGMHCVAYQKFSAPAVHASNLPIAMQSVFEISFLSMAWSWIVLALIVLVVTFGETRLARTVALICGFAVLIQAVVTVPMVGFFIGNEMIGAASLLIIIGSFLFQRSEVADRKGASLHRVSGTIRTAAQSSDRLGSPSARADSKPGTQ